MRNEDQKKKPYRKPQLKGLGAVESITLAKAVGPTDAILMQGDIGIGGGGNVS